LTAFSPGSTNSDLFMPESPIERTVKVHEN